MSAFHPRQTIGLAAFAATLGVGFMYYEYSQPPIPFKRDGNGNVTIPAGTRPEELFVNSAAGDFRLRPENPAIGAGVSLPEVITDIDGRVRDATRPTIGAHEFTGTPNTSGGSAAKFFSAPFTYFVLFSSLLANLMSLYLCRRVLQQLVFFGALKKALSSPQKKNRRNRRERELLVRELLVSSSPTSKEISSRGPTE